MNKIMQKYFDKMDIYFQYSHSSHSSHCQQYIQQNPQRKSYLVTLCILKTELCSWCQEPKDAKDLEVLINIKEEDPTEVAIRFLSLLKCFTYDNSVLLAKEQTKKNQWNRKERPKLLNKSVTNRPFTKLQVRYY